MSKKCWRVVGEFWADTDEPLPETRMEIVWPVTCHHTGEDVYDTAPIEVHSLTGVDKLEAESIILPAFKVGP